MTTSIEQRVRVEGVADTIRALEVVDPDLKKQLLRDVRKIAKTVAQESSGRAPRRSGDLASGYRVRSRNRKDGVSVTVFNRTAQGQILEFAGSKSGGSTGQGRSLIAGLTRRHGRTGRFMWQAMDRLNPEAQVERIVAKVDADLTERLRSADA